MHGRLNPKNKSSLFAKDMQEGVSSGSQIELEYLVISEIMSHCRHRVQDADVDAFTTIYSAVVEFANAVDVFMSLGP